MNSILYVSYYTEGYYENIMNQYLLPSLQKFNLPFLIQKFPSQNNWLKNTKLKTAFLLELFKTSFTDIVFLDADAEILQYPILFNQISTDYDIGVHYLDWFKFWRNLMGQKKEELLEGTLFLRNNEYTKLLLQEWNERNIHSDAWGQKILQGLLINRQNINVYRLPIEYCRIIKYDNNIPKNAVIIHHQASRQINKDKI